MKGLKFFYTIFLMNIICSCENASQPGTSNGVPERTAKPVKASTTTIISLFGEAEAIDSLVILYYTDKVKFRYYTFYTTSDNRHLSLLRENLLSDTISNNNCVREGTIYGYIQGNIYTTLYFNLSDSCRNLRLFKNGRLYNFALNASLQSELASLREKSINP